MNKIKDILSINPINIGYLKSNKDLNSNLGENANTMNGAKRRKVAIKIGSFLISIIKSGKVLPILGVRGFLSKLDSGFSIPISSPYVGRPVIVGIFLEISL
ncbi:hypothetical protein [Leptospirillum ferriphilum]|uniref:hypothetical protein n=1 Tax=Leptospirillum ferriphilum TaxID=178606 RepID=UPI00130E3EFB|nr:hypothetical protein [Leptospirillum ferriphilum]